MNKLIIKGMALTLTDNPALATQVSETLLGMAESEEFLLSQIFTAWSLLLDRGHSAQVIELMNNFVA